MTLKEEHKPLVFSLALHLGIVLMLVVRPYFSPEIKPFQKAIKVDIVAMPEKDQKIVKPKKKEAPKKKKKTAVAKKSKSIAKKANKKTPVPAKKSEDVDEGVDEMAALKKLKSIKAEQKREEILEETKIKGNRIAKGTDLVGVEKIEYTNYKTVLHSAISAEWDLPKWLVEGNLRAIAEIKIDNDGNLIYKKINLSSGNSIYDAKVMEAIEEASPFQPPPDKFKDIVLYEGVTLAFP